jgi:hypothetical protein
LNRYWTAGTRWAVGAGAATAWVIGRAIWATVAAIFIKEVFVDARVAIIGDVVAVGSRTGGASGVAVG